MSAFVSNPAALVFVTIALLAVSSPTPATLALFSATTSSPGNSWTNLTVQAATQNAPTSLAGGVVRLSWSASPTATTESVTYVVLRSPAGAGTYTAVAALTGLTYDDTPPADGSYDYLIRAFVSTFYRDSNLRTGLSDRTPPTVNVTCNGSACQSGWYASSVTVVVSATDAGSGVASITTTLDGSTTQTAGSSATLTVSGDGTHTLTSSAADSVGNTSTAQTNTIKVDATAPTAATAVAATAGTTKGTVNLSWTAGTDATSGVSGYTIRYVQATTCPAPTSANYPSAVSVGAVTSTTISGLVSAKNYCFYLVTIDNAGNQSAPSNVASAKAK